MVLFSFFLPMIKQLNTGRSIFCSLLFQTLLLALSGFDIFYVLIITFYLNSCFSEVYLFSTIPHNVLALLPFLLPLMIFMNELIKYLYLWGFLLSTIVFFWLTCGGSSIYYHDGFQTPLNSSARSKTCYWYYITRIPVVYQYKLCGMCGQNWATLPCWGYALIIKLLYVVLNFVNQQSPVLCHTVLTQYLQRRCQWEATKIFIIEI